MSNHRHISKPKFHLYRSKDSRGRFHPNWHYKYRDYDGKWKYGTYSKSKSETRAVAQELASRAFKIATGILPVPKETPQVQFQPLESIIAEFQQWGDTQGGRNGRPWSRQHSVKNLKLLKKLQSLLKWHTLKDISLADVDKIIQKLKSSGGERKQRLSPKSVAQYIERLKSFTLWAVKRGYLENNPLQAIGKLDVTSQSKRRSLTWDEVGRLLKAAPPDRSLVYHTAIITGLRANELYSLTVGSFNPARATIQLKADHAKDRKDAEIYLSVDLCHALKNSIVGKPDHARLLPGMHINNQCSFLYADMKKAGIARATKDGKCDFHALRKTHINLILQGGADVKTTQALARHKTPDLTMNLYGQAQEERMRKAVEGLGERIADMIADIIASNR